MSKILRTIVHSLMIVTTILIITINGNSAFAAEASSIAGTIIAFDGQQIQETRVSQERFDLLLEKGKYITPDILNKARIYTDVDVEENIVTVSDGLSIVRYYPDLGIKKVNGVEMAYGNEIKKVGSEVFISTNDIIKTFKLPTTLYKEKRRFLIVNNRESYKTATMRTSAPLFSSPKENATTVAQVNTERRLFLGQTTGKFVQVITENLEIGYIPSDTAMVVTDVKSNKYVPATRSQKINLVWEYVNIKTTNPTTIAEMPGVNVISPTWYNLAADTGTYKNKESVDYIRWVNGNSDELWPLVNNQMDKDLTRRFIFSANAREKFIESLLSTYINMGYKGINIDFENMYMQDKNQYTQFIAELSARFRQSGLIVSVDVTVPGGADTWSKCYDRFALGQLADYLVIMTYDEYYASSPVAGSVASYNWVDKHMTNLAKIVPPNKLIMGMPLYMRVWTETPPADPAGKVKLSSAAVSMATMQGIIKEKQLLPLWDQNARQNFVSYQDTNKDGVTVLKKAWIEDSVSIAEKVGISNRLGLAGVASWRRGFETPDIWPTIQSTLGLQ